MTILAVAIWAFMAGAAAVVWLVYHWTPDLSDIELDDGQPANVRLVYMQGTTGRELSEIEVEGTRYRVYSIDY